VSETPAAICHTTRPHTHDFLQISCVALVIALRRSMPSISGPCVSPRRCQLTSTDRAGNRPGTQSAIPFPNPGRVFVWRVWRVRVVSARYPVSRVCLISSHLNPCKSACCFTWSNFPSWQLFSWGRTHVLDTSSQVNVLIVDIRRSRMSAGLKAKTLLPPPVWRH
jgi:hypothetical protein